MQSGSDNRQSNIVKNILFLRFQINVLYLYLYIFITLMYNKDVMILITNLSLNCCSVVNYKSEKIFFRQESK